MRTLRSRIVAGLVLGGLPILACSGIVAPDGAPAGSPAMAPPRLDLVTAHGTIAIELDRAAAPRAVAEILRRAAEERYYDGLGFGHVKPGIELATDLRSPDDGARLEHEVDFVALGLDRLRVASAGEAMDLLQLELLPAESETRSRRQPARTAQLGEWAETYRRTDGSDFLVGVSRAEILEALGYRASRGLASLPPGAGAVALQPSGPNGSGLGLAILLVDRPELTGRRVVIGRVVEGLGLAERLSRRPMRQLTAEDPRPADPVRIERAVVR